ncbi:MAG: DUF1318 domain-containing protein [Candidatus Methylomirabilis sp.]
MCRYKEHLLILTLTALVTVAACAIITVNVYFPEKDVKSAYKSLEDELLQPTPKKEDSTPSPKPRSHLEQPRVLLAVASHWRIALVPDAFAQEDLAQRITEEIKGYPEVVAAYKGRGQRLARLRQLKDQGLVGEGKDGKVVLRGKPPQVGDAEATLVQEENKDREVIMNGMAKAILKLSKQEPTSSNMSKARIQATETFASLRRDEAQPGWWIQLPEDGTWKKK